MSHRSVITHLISTRPPRDTSRASRSTGRHPRLRSSSAQRGAARHSCAGNGGKLVVVVARVSVQLNAAVAVGAVVVATGYARPLAVRHVANATPALPLLRHLRTCKTTRARSVVPHLRTCSAKPGASSASTPPFVPSHGDVFTCQMRQPAVRRVQLPNAATGCRCETRSAAK